MPRPNVSPRQPRDPVTYRFQSILSRELVDELCKTHEEGKDYRNVTAARCQVHPKLLSKWLKLGRDSETAGLATELYLRFTAIEGEIRAGWIAELEDTSAGSEECQYEDGQMIGRTSTTRRTNGLQWLMERRFRQYRGDYVLHEDEVDALDMLQPQPAAMTAEMAVALCRQLAQQPERLPAEIRALFAATDWRAPKTLETNGQETSH